MCCVKNFVQLGLRKKEFWFSLDSSSLIFNGIKQEHFASEEISMSTLSAVATNRFNINLLFVASLLALTVSGASLADTTDDERSSVSRHIVSGGRDNPAASSESIEEYESLVISGLRDKEGTRSGSAKTGSGLASAQNFTHDFWIFDADIVLFNDDDNDGFYHGIDLLFDADTIYSAAEVYAVMYLSLDLGPWNEYGVTEDFWIFGASGTDEYVLVTELMSGYHFLRVSDPLNHRH
jgi:hypothetical protein